MSHPTIHDDEVARLPLTAAREELLREITSTPVASRPVRRRPRWVPAAAAAAAVAVFAVPAYVVSHRDEAGPAGSTGRGGAATAPPSVPGGGWVVLRRGWLVENLFSSNPMTDGVPGLTQISYVEDDKRLMVMTYPTVDLAGYVDREGVRSTATRLLGRPATLLTYDSTEHAVVRPLDGSRYVEVRGEGMDLPTFQAVLADLVETDDAGFASVVSRGTVTPFNRDAKIRALLKGVTVPPGFTAADVPLVGFNNDYQASARVVTAVKCAWLGLYDQPATRQEALAAFDSSRTWPLLEHIEPLADDATPLWTIGSRLRSGTPSAELGKDCR